jgi:hypothetical protein
MDACLKMNALAQDPRYGNASSAFAKALKAEINHVYKGMLPRIYRELEALAAENGESSNGFGEVGAYTEMIGNLQAYMGAMAEHYGLVKSREQKPVVQPSTPTIDPSALLQGAKPSDTIR